MKDHKSLKAICVLFLFLLSSTRGRGERVGLNIGYFYPSSSSVRDLYGSNWFLSGVSIPINVYETSREERMEYISLDYIHNSYSGVFEGYPYDASIFNIPLMYNTRYRSVGKNFYYVYGVGFNYLKVTVYIGGKRESDSEIDIGSQFALGYGTNNFGVELRYIEFGRTGNTGLSLTLVGRF